MSDLPAIRTQHPHVESRPDILEGSPVIRGTKVPVRRIWAWYQKGVEAEVLMKRYVQLGPAKVLDALSFAFDNQDVMSADIERERVMLDDHDRRSFESDQLSLRIRKSS